MPAVALSRVGAREVESGPDGQILAADTWQRLEALPDPRSRQGRIYPLACLIAVALCAFTAAGNDRFTAVGQWVRRASQADLAVDYARRMLSPPQQLPQEPVRSMVDKAVHEWDAGRAAEAEQSLRRAVRAARDLGYL
jgi:DDE family transposase